MRPLLWLAVTAGFLASLLPGASAVTRTPGTASPRSVTQPAAGAPGHPRIGVAYGDTLTWADDAELAQALDDAVALHAHWVRVDLSWADVQPVSSRRYSWGRFDRLVAAARARGLHLLPVVGYTPAWARDSGCGSFACPPHDPAAFARFAALAARRYSSQGVHTWEIWNEENIPVFWTRPSPRRYASMLGATTRAVHRNDPVARVLLGGLASTDTKDGSIDPRQFLRGVCASGGCAGLGGVAYHPYTFPYLASDSRHATAWRRIEATRWSLRSVLDAHGLRRQRIWLTEYGAPTGGPGTASDGSPGSVTPTTDHVTEDRQARIAADGVATADRSPNVAALFWYTDRDDPGYPSNVAWFGLRRSDGSQKPAWRSFADAAAAAGG